MDENFRLQILTRQKNNDLNTLSFDVREQQDFTVACPADLLKEAGRPRLIILDDVLVHCDAERAE